MSVQKVSFIEIFLFLRFAPCYNKENVCDKDRIGGAIK